LRPGQWTWQDAEAARQEANATARPHGVQGPTPEQGWQGRPPICRELGTDQSFPPYDKETGTSALVEWQAEPQRGKK
jgi:hypothetical protein